MEVDGTFESLTKKEVARLGKEKSKLEKNLGGIKEMKELPGIIFIIDTKKEEIAVSEARKMNIPIVAVVDTNCNPDGIDFPIPGNDDAIRAITLFTQIIANAVVEAENEVGLEVIDSLHEDGETAPQVAAIAADLDPLAEREEYTPESKTEKAEPVEPEYSAYLVKDEEEVATGSVADIAVDPEAKSPAGE